MSVTVIALKYASLISQQSCGHFLKLIQFCSNNAINLSPFYSTHYIVLYPQNGGRVVTIDSVTSLHPVCNGSDGPHSRRCSGNTISSAFHIYAHPCSLLVGAWAASWWHMSPPPNCLLPYAGNLLRWAHASLSPITASGSVQPLLHGSRSSPAHRPTEHVATAKGLIYAGPTWQGRRSYAFFWVRTHPLSSGWVWIGIGPTHFLR